MVALAIERLRHFEAEALSMHEDGYYVAFSGGKDSIVLLDLVRRSGVKHTAHYHLTTVDPPEVVRFIRTQYPDVAVDHPSMTMWDLIVKKRMPPSRIVRYCCEYLKEGRGQPDKYGAGRFVCIGIRWAESAKRSKRRMTEACRQDRTKRYLSPIIDWSDDDVWAYIRDRGLAYPSLYDEGFKRLGCIGCPMTGAGMRRLEFERWPKYETAYIRAFQRAVDARKRDCLQDSDRGAKWTDGQAMFDWWMDENRAPAEDEDQACLVFEDQ